MTLPPPRPDLGELARYHSPQLEVTVRLNTNESPYPPPPDFVAAWLDGLRAAPLHRYPDREARTLRAALGERLAQPAGRLFCANGSNEVLQCLCLAYGGSGRRAAVFEPTYALHSHIAHLTGTAVVEGQRRPDFSLDLDEVGDVVLGTAPAITFLCSPNNPTGLADDPAAVRTVLAAVPVRWAMCEWRA